MKLDADKARTILEHLMEVWTADESIKYLENERDPEKPFFMQVSFERPHPPLTVPDGCLFKYAPEKLTLPPNQDELPLNKTFFFDRNVELKWCTLEHGEGVLREDLAMYYSLILLIDQQIGRVLYTVNKLGLREDTIVIFVPTMAILPGNTRKWPYGCIYRVPFIWRYPGIIRENIAHDGLAESIIYAV